MTQVYQFWVDTSGAHPILKIRNGANSAWITVGQVDVANLGHLPLTGGTLTGTIVINTTDYLQIPAGTTAQRPGSPAVGMIRWNSDLSTYEGYNGSAWASIGGGGFVPTTVQTISSGGTINSSTTDNRQLRIVQGDSGQVTISTTPFGTGGNWKDGTEILLIGNDNTNTIVLTFNDAANGLVGNFSTIEVGQYKPVLCVYSSALSRWIVTGGEK